MLHSELCVPPVPLSSRWLVTHCPPGGKARLRGSVTCRKACGATQQTKGQGQPLERRSFLAGTSALVALIPSLLPRGGMASSEGMKDTITRYADDVDRFSISVPADWEEREGSAANLRRAVAWFPTGEADTNATNITVLITNIGADYTRLGSFGTAEQFGTNLVSSMDRSFLLKSPFRSKRDPPRVQQARLLDARERDSKYFLEYTVQRPEEDEPRHLLSVVAMGYNGRLNRLYTVTGQCVESEVPRYRALLQQSMQSFQSPPLPQY